MQVVLFDFIFERTKPGITGLSDIVWEYGEALQQAGIDVHIVGPYPANRTGPQDVHLHSFPIPEFLFRNILGHILVCYLGLRYIKRNFPNADILHCHEYLSSAIFCLLSNYPVVLTTPGHILERIHSQSNPFDPVTTVVYRIAATVSSRRCAKIVAISSDMHKWWKSSGATEEQLITFPYGFSTIKFHPIQDQNLMHELGWNEDETHLLYVGRLSKEKGVNTLIEAFEVLLKRYSGLRLHIVGDGSLRPAIHQQVEEANLEKSVSFHGWIDKGQLPRYYTGAFSSIFPSRSEPLGRVVIEAMACGTLVLGSKVGGIPDLIDDKVTGLLFEAGNISDLVDKLSWELDYKEEARKIARNGLETTHQNLPWKVMAQKIVENVYETIQTP